jgi:hypothetical protein
LEDGKLLVTGGIDDYGYGYDASGSDLNSAEMLTEER